MEIQWPVAFIVLPVWDVSPGRRMWKISEININKRVCVILERYILVHIHQLQRTRSQEPAEQYEFRLKSLVNLMFHDFARRIFYSTALFELCFDNTWGWCPKDLRACLLLCSQLLYQIFFRKAKLLLDWWWPFCHCASPPICSTWSPKSPKYQMAWNPPPHVTCYAPTPQKIRQKLLYFFFPSKIKRVLSQRQTKPTSKNYHQQRQTHIACVGAKKLNTTAKTAADGHLAR